MARYPGAEREQRIEAGALLRQVTEIFAACGMSDDDAALLADSLVQADLRGIHSHGVLRVPDYVAKLTREGVNPRGVPRVGRVDRSDSSRVARRSVTHMADHGRCKLPVI